MNRQSKQFSQLRRVRWMVVLLVALGLIGSSSGFAQANSPVVIVMQGSGDVRVTPDTMVVWMGVQWEGDAAVDALRGSYGVVAKITEIFKEYAPEDRIKTSEFYLYRSEGWDSSQNRSVVGPFVVRHVLEVPVRELELGAEMIDRAVDAGANVIQNIQYGVADDTEARKLAYERALEQARWKAAVVAPPGTELVTAEIRDSYTTGPMFGAQGGSAVYDLPSLYMPGQLKLAVNLEVVFHAVKTAE